MKNSIACIILCLSTMCLNAQDTLDETMYKAYLSNESVPETWKQVVASRKELWKKDGRDQHVHFQLALAQFGLLASTMRNQDEDLFDEYYDSIEDELKVIMEAEPKWGEPYSLLSSVYGLKMSYSPMQGIFLGAKSGSLSEKGAKLSPKSPLVWKVIANAKLFTPEMWGGDINESIEAFEKCVQLYETDPAGLKFNWMYLDALAFMGQAYVKNGDTGKAISAYEKALKAEPEFGWVKHVLLPQAKAKVPKG